MRGAMTALRPLRGRVFCLVKALQSLQAAPLVRRLRVLSVLAANGACPGGSRGLKKEVFIRPL